MIRIFFACVLVFLGCAHPALSQETETIEDIFSPDTTQHYVMQVEAALAIAQAQYGVVPVEAAEEIRAKSTLNYAPPTEVAEEYAKVRHRMVALLNVWRRSLSAEAQTALHYGATTVDIYDTTRLLQTLAAIDILQQEMREAEEKMITLMRAHRDTPMVGRTLGQHALPITFGKKVAVWAAANRRNMDRLSDVQCRLEELGVMRGAVGTHLGLGDKGREIERAVARQIGLSGPHPADWHGMRDVFGEYASTLAIAARTYAGIGEEVFLMQMTDIGELYETRPASAVSSSTMPHKRNPSRSERLMHHGRVIPAKAGILMDDIANKFERDNTSRPNAVLADISINAENMVRDLNTLLRRLDVNEARMRENLDRTDGMILAQRIVFAVQSDLGKQTAEHRVAAAATQAIDEGTSFRAALLADDQLRPLIAENIDDLLDPTSYLGLAAEQVDDTIDWLTDAPSTSHCRTAD